MAMKLLKLVSCLFFLYFGLAHAEDQQPGKDSKKNIGSFKVCTTGGFIPFSSYSNGGWEGFDIDMMKDFSSYLKKKLEIINYNIDGIIPALNTKKYDMIAAGLTITDERKKSILFSDPYFTSGIVYLFKKNNLLISDIKSPQELNNPKFKVGVKLGTTSDFYAAKNLNKSIILKFNEYGDVINAVRNNKVDTIIIDLSYGVSIEKKFPGVFEYKNTDSNNENFCVASRQNEKVLIKKFNEFLKQWKSSGKYDQIFNKHFN
ncbi:MAG: transporter substrate-binding domain-containing protein [Silvanigrellaceae bacterium]|nr:transporter substrate-binding domain-containing protein [Silvanigrellaceae bacterium]